MELGLGKLGWPPLIFWRSTLLELSAAAEGLAKFHGAGSESNAAPCSRDEMNAMIEKSRAS